MTAAGEAARIDRMLNPPQIRRRLGVRAAAAFRGDRAVLDETAAWLTSVTARELLRIDYYARQLRGRWPTRQRAMNVLESPPPGLAALASMHPDGHVRERAVRSLAASFEPLGDRALAVRVTDHVGVVRELATREVLRRTRLAHADRIVPLLHRIEHRGRGADVLPLYLHALATEHGEAGVWARLRGSADHDLRRFAFRHSFDAGLLGPQDAVVSFAKERDQVVRRQLIRVIADSASPDVIARVLLRGRSAESRVLGLVKLTAEELDPADVERLLVDSSVLVRLWARRRWQEMGHDPAAIYAAVARSTATPAVLARAYAGLVETRTPIARGEVLDLVHSTELPLRKVGLSLLRDAAAAEDVPLLLSFVAGDHSRLARLASDVLTHNPTLWSIPDLAPLKTAETPELRRRAWRIHRHLSGWEAVIADLEILRDPDPHVAALGQHLLPPMYFTPTDTQRQRIADLLVAAPLGRDQLLSIATTAGLPDLVTTPAPTPVPAAPRSRWWRVRHRPPSA
jgi:hypothetical protein